MEKQKILEILYDWNFWDKNFPKTYKRKSYEELVEKYDKTD